MRVLFTSLFFGLVAILTFASHPPIEQITSTFGDTETPQINIAQAPLAPPQAPLAPPTPIPPIPREEPTGIIPIADTSTPSNSTLPDPMPVPVITAPKPDDIEPTANTVVAPPTIQEHPDPSPLEYSPPPEDPAPALEDPPLQENSDTPSNRSYVRALNLHAVYFSPGETDLPEKGRPGLNTVATRLATIPEGISVVYIGAHTDAHSEASNAPEIGNLRARAVLDSLVAAGAPADRLAIAHYPTSKKRSKTSEAWRDRRVEFHLFPPR